MVIQDIFAIKISLWLLLILNITSLYRCEMSVSDSELQRPNKWIFEIFTKQGSPLANIAVWVRLIWILPTHSHVFHANPKQLLLYRLQSLNICSANTYRQKEISKFKKKKNENFLKLGVCEKGNVPGTCFDQFASAGDSAGLILHKKWKKDEKKQARKLGGCDMTHSLTHWLTFSGARRRYRL